MKLGNITIVGLIIALFCIQASWAGHPAEGKLLPESASSVMGERTGVPNGWDINDLTFGLVGECPRAEELTYLEVYMVVGAEWKENGKMHGMRPWSSEIATIAHRYYDLFGYIPSVFNADVIRQTPGFEDKSDYDLELYRNPLTGAWPRVDATYHSPGDMYIRPLTESEMHHFAALHEPHQERWFDRSSYSLRADCYVGIEMLNEPFYLRVYGYDETLVSRIDYMWREDI